MSEVIRDTFIALHSSDILRKLEAEVSMSRSYRVPRLLNANVAMTVPGALRQPRCTAVGDSEGNDPQDALESGLSHFGVQGRGCGARERSGRQLVRRHGRRGELNLDDRHGRRRRCCCPDRGTCGTCQARSRSSTGFEPETHSGGTGGRRRGERGRQRGRAGGVQEQVYQAVALDPATSGKGHI